MVIVEGGYLMTISTWSFVGMRLLGQRPGLFADATVKKNSKKTAVYTHVGLVTRCLHARAHIGARMWGLDLRQKLASGVQSKVRAVT
jgi:hypothetical protein